MVVASEAGDDDEESSPPQALITMPTVSITAVIQVAALLGIAPPPRFEADAAT
jgi:hypothetical protein